MDGLQPQPASITLLAGFIFSLVIALYLLSMPQKSKDAYLIIGHYSIFTVLYLAAFFNSAIM